MSHVTVPGCECECANCVVYAHDTMGHLSLALCIGRVQCTPHTIQRLGRRIQANAVCETDFIPSVAPSHAAHTCRECSRHHSM